jgi:hypothetical protein
MKRWIAFGLVGATAIAVMIALVTQRSDRPATTPQTGSDSVRPLPSGLDPLVEDFRATERTCLLRFNNALREQRAGAMDELELSNVIERDVLTPWRALRARVTSAPEQDALYGTLRRYLELRQLSWEAYVTALRAPSDEAARPHYEAHRQKNAEAQEQARDLGQKFREAAERAAR